MRNTLISLDIFGDRYPWEGNRYSAGDNRAAMAKMKRALLDVMRYELTDCQREVVEQFYFHDMSVTQIASERGCNKSTVSRHLKRAKVKIRRCLQYGYYPSHYD